MSAVNVIVDRYSGKSPETFLLALTLVMATLLLPARAQSAEGEQSSVAVQVIALLNFDELGEPLRYPSFVTYDHDMDEIYVVGGGKSKIIVYGSNFFPTVSLGPGRGVDAPRGVYIHRDGTIYVCQGKTSNKPGRITLFNPAFFKEDEINLDQIPEAEDFSPRNVVIGLTGKMYVAGQNTRGLLVLDSAGNFSHWLRPMDRIYNPEAIKEATLENMFADEAGADETMADEFEEEEDTLDMTDLLPPGLLPSKAMDYKKERKPGHGPVKVTDVATDKEGHIYILSEETSKVYVYSHSEEFLFSFGQKGGSTGKMSRPRGLVVDEKKKAVYIVDYMRHTVLIFDMGGIFMHEFGGMGGAAGWFQYPSSLALTRDGYLLVADLFNQRVQVLDIDFEYRFPLFQNPENGQQRPEVKTPEEVEKELKKEEGPDILQPVPLGQ
ncbi:NHL repeat-containing protein [Desulfolithobacter sp.]